MNARLAIRLLRPAVPTTYQTMPPVTVKSTDCSHCNPTARAIRWVQAKWVEAGIDKGEC